MTKDGSTVRYVGTVPVRLNFREEVWWLVQYAFFVIVWVRHVGTLFERPPIEMQPMITMSHKRLLFFQFQFL